MVKKYIILADKTNVENFKIPRQLIEIDGEPLIKRTIRLLKENGITDITITSHDKRFDNLGVKRYEPKHNVYDPTKKIGYWLNAFPIELLTEPLTFLFGDVYYSENAIKTIVNRNTLSTLFFCTYENHSAGYIKTHDEPLAYKVVNYKLFKEHIEIVKKMKDEGLCFREPIAWELYRSINDIDITEHKVTTNCVIINDESCDIDSVNDIEKMKTKIGGIKMVTCEVVEKFTLDEFDKLKNIKRKSVDTKGTLYVGDTFDCDHEMAKYLTGGNPKGKVVVKVLEIIPIEAESKTKPKKKKTNKK